MLKGFLIWVKPGLFLFIFVLFRVQLELKKAYILCWVFKPGAAGW